MSDGEPASDHGATSVGVVAPEADPTGIVDAVADAGGVVAASRGATAATDADAVVAVGDAGLGECVAAGVGGPVLPIDVDGIASLPRGDSSDGIERFLAGEYPVREQPVMAVETPTVDGRALRDIALMTAEPATISEFAVATDDTGSDRDPGAADTSVGSDAPLARVRADGVVVATPAGSRGYARAAGGPVVVAGSDAAAVVPIAPFATDPDHWVVPLSAIALTVERDDADVELFVDGRSLGSVAPGTTVEIVRDGTLRLASPSRV
ncbi:NAD(+)/NADH kinase [Halococcus agarilyticus]|uniref:NAD(+)/NADH kinase n=1 Tax=Halococcus agarilyticus TaxID=1232219 RepID=UPI0006777847|nr:NAD(+)/NADH kinase [Halococcus agarilyticus]